MASRVRPYRFSELERWTRSQLRVLKTLDAYLPGSALGTDFKQALKDAISKLVGAEVDIWLDTILPSPAAEVLKRLTDPACLAVISMPPSEYQAVLDLDLKLASMAVDKMLGGSGEDADPSRPLSSIEQGLVSFILLKLMHTAQGMLAEEQQVALRLKRIYAHPEDLGSLLKDSEQVVLGFKLFLDMHVGYARLIIPADMIQTTLAAPIDPNGPVFARRLDSLRKRINRVRDERTVVVVEAGRSELSEADLAGVDVGDILLVERTGLQKTVEGLNGSVEVRVGQGTHGIVRGNLVELENGHQGVEITAIEALAEPDPVDDEQATPEEASPGEAVEEAYEAEEARHTPLTPRGTGVTVRGCPRGFGADSPVIGAGGDADPDGRLDALLDQEGGEHQVDDEDAEPVEEDQYEEEQPTDDGAVEEIQDNLGETESLLKDIPMPVVIELGRIKTTAGDIINLRAGQILELRRAPSDPVNITVNGKLVGKGELVEVEGELGVRVLSLVR